MTEFWALSRAEMHLEDFIGGASRFRAYGLDLKATSPESWDILDQTLLSYFIRSRQISA